MKNNRNHEPRRFRRRNSQTSLLKETVQNRLPPADFENIVPPPQPPSVAEETTRHLDKMPR